MELHQLDLLYGCVKSITLREETEDFPEQFINAIGEKIHAATIADLSSLLREQESTGAVECIELANAGSSELAVRLLTATGSGGETTTYFFRIKDAAIASTLPVLGVLLAVYAANPVAAVVPGVTLAKTFWTHLISLHHQQDNSALEVIRAISALRARQVSQFQRLLAGNEFPSTEEISAYLPEIPLEQVQSGLTRLESLGLIQCKQWGDQARDFSHKENRWREKI